MYLHQVCSQGTGQGTLLRVDGGTISFLAGESVSYPMFNKCSACFSRESRICIYVSLCKKQSIVIDQIMVVLSVSCLFLNKLFIISLSINTIMSSILKPIYIYVSVIYQYASDYSRFICFLFLRY